MPGIGAVGARCRHRPRRRPNKAEASGAPGEGALDAAIWLYQFRLIVLGDSTVGKSCLLHRFAEGRFPGPVKSDPTVGVDFYSRLVEIEPGKRIKLLLWDTAGQERFRLSRLEFISCCRFSGSCGRGLGIVELDVSPAAVTGILRDITQKDGVLSVSRSITRSYYRHSVGGLLVFDITNRSSFDHVRDWLEEAKMHADPFQLVFNLVGHKCDLESQRQVSRAEAEELASACGMKYIETSAKDATNVEESFTILTTDIYELVKKGEISAQDGWEGVKSDYIPDGGPSLERAYSPGEHCPC